MKASFFYFKIIVSTLIILTPIIATADKRESDFAWWKKESKMRQKKINKYLRKYRKEYQSFYNKPLGNTGVPWTLWSMFKESFPEIWNDKSLRDMGLFPTKNYGYGLPFGFAIGNSGRVLIDRPLLNKIRVNIVNLTCAACHTAHVKGPDGVVRKIIGAPTNTFDAHKFRDTLFKVANHKNFNSKFLKEKMVAMRKKHGVRWPYHKKGLKLFQAFIDRKVFKQKTELIVEGVKKNLTTIEIKRKKLLSRFYGPRAKSLVNGGVPGSMDAFSTAAFILVPDDFDSFSPMKQEATMKKYFGEGPPLIDTMSVWNQNARPWAQWDGNIPAKLLRNLGSAIAVIRDPVLVNFHVVKDATVFVDKLPSPPYPFKVARSKVERGKTIYKRACMQCHDGGGKFIPINVIKTDRNRAVGLTEFVRRNGVSELLKSCKDPKTNKFRDQRCNLPSNKVIIPRTKNPGYVAQPLDGIWARAPYFHNGSVPTLYHLLVPRERPSKFYRGNLTYDQKKVGFVWDKRIESKYTQNTSIPGYANSGHSDKELFFDGIDFGSSHKEREDLIEYLKTL